MQYLIKKLTKAGSSRYATDQMVAYRDEALAILHEFEDSDARKGLEELVRYTTDRKY